MSKMNVRVVDDRSSDKAFNSRMADYPCAFNLDVPNIAVRRLNVLGPSLRGEIEEKHNIPEETVQALNFLTWIEYKLDNARKAMRYSDKAIKMTERKNLPSLANKAFLLWFKGDEIGGRRMLAELDALKQTEEFNTLLTDATAYQAFCRFRLGGPQNLPHSIRLYTEAVNQKPNMFLWKLGLGVVYRRASHGNIFAQMPGQPSMRDYIQRAAGLLYDVAENAVDHTLRARAFAELANIHSAVDNNVSNAFQLIFCDKAVTYGQADSWMLTTCGKMLSFVDVERAIDLLEKAIKVRKNTTAYHHLGVCYEKKARNEAEKTSVSDKSEVKKIGYALYQHFIEFAVTGLDRDHEYVEKAIENYEFSLTVSQDANIPAMYDLGILLKDCGETEEALQYFNQITKQDSLDISHLVTVTLAYEQAGLCNLQMMEECDEDQKQQLKEDAEYKLQQAVNLSAQMAASINEMKDLSEEMWIGFRQFCDRNTDDGHDPVTKDKRLLDFYQKVKRYGAALEVIKKLMNHSDDQLDDPNVIECGLKSYLAEKRYEEAHTFLNLALTRRSAIVTNMWQTKSLKSLSVKVHLFAASEKFKKGSGDGKFILKSLFTSQYMRGMGGAVTFDLDEVPVGEVLIVYDDIHDTEEGKSAVSTVALAVQRTILRELELVASLNLQSCQVAGVHLEIKLSQIKRHRVVVILIGEEEKSSEFEAIMEYVTSIRHQCEEGQVPPNIFVATTSPNAQVPLTLRAHHNLCIETIMTDLSRTSPSLGSRSEATPPYGSDAETMLRNKQRNDSRCVRADALLALFCFLMGKIWPLPEDNERGDVVNTAAVDASDIAFN